MPKAIQFSVPSQPAQPDPFRLPRINGGVSYKYEQSQIADNQSPHMLNCLPDDQGNPEKRPGQEYLFETSLGASAILGFFDYTKLDGTTGRILAHGTKLYTQSDTDQPNEILTGLTANKGVGFVFNDTFYYLNGAEYVEYDGTTAQATIGKVPQITQSRNPDGTGGTSYEELNRISDSWKDGFTGDGTSTDYYLSFTGLSATEVQAWVNGVAKTEDTGSGGDFTVNRTTGVIAFGSAPANDAEVIIQAEKDGLNDATAITKCRRATIFGAATRVFLTGNPDYPSAVYWCNVDDPTYFPVSNFSLVGSDAQANANMAVLYDQLIILKERSIYRMDFEILDGVAVFPVQQLNNAVGCDIPESVQLIDNILVFANTYGGVFALVRTDVETEKNVARISGNINAGTVKYDGINVGILNESKSDLQAATGIDWNGKYILCVGNKAWAWDYRLTPYIYTGKIDSDEERLAWFPLTNINANCWLVKDGDLYYGDRDVGKVVKLTPGGYGDFGEAIDAKWRSKLWHFGLPEWLKFIEQIHFRSREGANTRITVQYYKNDGEDAGTIDVTSKSFSWDTFSWELFTWDAFNFPPVFRLRPKIKKTSYFQFEVSNDTLRQNLSVMDLVVRYRLTKIRK